MTVSSVAHSNPQLNAGAATSEPQSQPQPHILARVTQAIDLGRIQVINVAGQDARMRFVSEQLRAAGIKNFSRFDALTPEKAREKYQLAPQVQCDIEDARSSLDNRYVESWNAFACAASHMESWRQMVEDPSVAETDVFVVFEDDATYRPEHLAGHSLPDVRAVIGQTLVNAQEKLITTQTAKQDAHASGGEIEPGIVLLGYMKPHLEGLSPAFDEKGEPVDKRPQLYTLKSLFVGAHAYAMTKKVARQMLQIMGTRVDCHIDYLMGTLARLSEIEAKRSPDKAIDAFSVVFIAPRPFVQNFEVKDVIQSLPTTLHHRPNGRGKMQWHEKHSIYKLTGREEVVEQIEAAKSKRAQLSAENTIAS